MNIDYSKTLCTKLQAMLTFLNILVKKKHYGYMAIVILLGVLSPRFVASVLLNQANLAHIQGANAFTLYQRALALAPTNMYIRWQAARAALDVNDNSMASKAIEPLRSFANSNPLLFADVLRIWVANGQSAKVITQYEANRTLNQSLPVSDTVALAYMDQAKFEQALALRPDDLYLGVQLWQRSETATNTTKIANIREKLVYFPPSAINPTNERILQYTSKGILQLLESGVWTRKEAIRAVMYLIWKHSGVTEIEELLRALHTHYSNESTWSDLAAELVQRQVKPSVYNSLSSVDNREKAEKNLVQSTRLNSYDRTMMASGNVYWHWGVWQGKDSRNALFFGGSDPLESSSALRIMNLWQRPINANEVPPYAEYVSEGITLEPDMEYTLALRYKTDKLGEAVAFVALLDYTGVPRFTFVHTPLLATHGDWQTWKMSGKSYVKPITVQLLLRMWGMGSIWFDDVQLVKGDVN